MKLGKKSKIALSVFGLWAGAMSIHHTNEAIEDYAQDAKQAGYYRYLSGEVHQECHANLVRNPRQGDSVTRTTESGLTITSYTDQHRDEAKRCHDQALSWFNDYSKDVMERTKTLRYKYGQLAYQVTDTLMPWVDLPSTFLHQPEHLNKAKARARMFQRGDK